MKNALCILAMLTSSAFAASSVHEFTLPSIDGVPVVAIFDSARPRTPLLFGLRMGDSELCRWVRSAQGFVETSTERGDVARDATVVIAGDYSDLETRKEPRPAEIRTIGWQLLSAEKDDPARV